MRLRRSELILIALMLVGDETVLAAAGEDAAPFSEVFERVRSHLKTATPSELNRAAVEGFIKELKGAAIISRGTNTPGPSGERTVIAKTAVVEGEFGYARVETIGTGLGGDLASAVSRLGSTNKLKGLVLDLRFASGATYEPISSFADEFIPTERNLFKIGDTTVRGGGKTGAWSLPLAVLINGETAGAAEVLAAVVRLGNTGVIIGGNSAGLARSYESFPLTTGDTLRLAAGGIELASGERLGSQGVQPDIAIMVSPEAEKQFLDDPYGEIPVLDQTRTGGNRGSASPPGDGRRRRINEADLVRMQKEGVDPHVDPTLPAPPVETRKPSIKDPALARAVDLLKGLAITQTGR